MSMIGTRRTALAGLVGVLGGSAVERARGTAAPQSGEIGRSPTASFAYDVRASGARMNSVDDDSAALRDALSRKRAVLIEGRMLIDQVVDLPMHCHLIGTGAGRSEIVLGPGGRLRIAGRAHDDLIRGVVMRDLTIARPEEPIDQVALELRNAEHILFDNVHLYKLHTLLDNHHYVAFRNCRFTGDGGAGHLTSICESQPGGYQLVNECLSLDHCFSSGHPFDLTDTVETRFTNCLIFTGSHGIRSRRKLAAGSEREPFYSGPIVSGCTFDSIDGIALDIDGGGTNCRLVGNFFSSGRKGGVTGVRLSNAMGVEIVGNHFEWCGANGLTLDRCDQLSIVGNNFLNQARGHGIAATRSTRIRVIGNGFENRPLWGGSTDGGTQLAIATPRRDASGWVVTGNTAHGLLNPAGMQIEAPAGSGTIVRDNPGFPAATEQGWPTATTADRPRDVRDGFGCYDATLGIWVTWHAPSRRWRDAVGKPV